MNTITNINHNSNESSTKNAPHICKSPRELPRANTNSIHKLSNKIFLNFLAKHENIHFIDEIERIVAISNKLTCEDIQIKNIQLKKQKQLKAHKFKERELAIQEAAFKFKCSQHYKPDLSSCQKEDTKLQSSIPRARTLLRKYKKHRLLNLIKRIHPILQFKK